MLDHEDKHRGCGYARATRRRAERPGRKVLFAAPRAPVRGRPATDRRTMRVGRALYDGFLRRN